ncbi:hypothetical protein INT47_007113 [Mucor saturninus]|uniref:RNA-directed DNA polymerase n=1 Tax=Mucor saturninus TaxID=64648 RepID=A0A8H7QEE6_9FUNG|nr:hypothetical protein INT47_007113 [Mucor saturninus]
MVESMPVYAAEHVKVGEPSTPRKPYARRKGKAPETMVPIPFAPLNPQPLPTLQQQSHHQGQFNTHPAQPVHGQEDVHMRPVQGGSTQPRRPRQPPRHLPVKLHRKDVWEKLKNVDAGLSVADWLLLDRTASKDVKDGLRFLTGRKKKVPALGVNLVQHQEDSSEESASFYSDDWESQSVVSDEVNFGSDSELDGYDSDDTVYSYKYDYQDFASSQPLRAPITINDQVLPAIFDSGASVSVISKTLAVKLGLVPNGDRLPLSSLDGQAHPPCDITVNVPIRVAGKLRPDTMCIKEGPGNQDLCLLGMTWFRKYGIQLRLKDGCIIIPTKHGASSVELQGQTREFGMSGVGAPIYSINVRKESVVGGRAHVKDTLQEEKLLDYVEEVMSVSEKEEEVLPQGIASVVEAHQDAFVENSGLGRVNLLDHEIPVTTSEPIRSRPYRLTWEEDESLKRELDNLLALGLIRPSRGLWTSPVFFVRKRDNTLRLVVDYRKLNQVTIKDAFPLPHIDDLLDSLGGSSLFSTLDAASGYWQVPVAEESIERTGFVTRQGTFEFTVMPFGLTSAPSTFQRTMSMILGEYIGDFVYVFIDDVIIFSKTLAEHEVHLSLVFEACKKANLKLKRSKCFFAQPSVEYLGHVVSGSGLSPCSRNVEKLLALVVPRNTNEVHTFLGMAGYYRRFVHDYAKVAQPLVKMLKKNVSFVWGPEQETAFLALRAALVSPPILAFPDRQQVQILTTDASTRGLGAVLSQAPEDSLEDETVISYGSRGLRGSEKNYAATHLEALALIWGVVRYRHYLAGRHFILRTDHAALVYIIKNPNPSPKLSRWAAALMEYDFTLKHQPGRDNPADALSRLLPL